MRKMCAQPKSWAFNLDGRSLILYLKYKAAHSGMQSLSDYLSSIRLGACEFLAGRDAYATSVAYASVRVNFPQAETIVLPVLRRQGRLRYFSKTTFIVRTTALVSNRNRYTPAGSSAP